jgi:hypothetical protein
MGMTFLGWLVDGASAANRTATEAQFAMNNFSFIPGGGMFERFDFINGFGAYTFCR